MSKHRSWQDATPGWTIPASGLMRPARSDRVWVTRPQSGRGKRRRTWRHRLMRPVTVVALTLTVLFGD